MYYNLISILLIFNIIFSDSNIEKYLYKVLFDGNIGDNLYAIESGYISRISINPTGYGKAIYLKLEDGNTVVYAHLDHFMPELDNLINALELV